MPPRRVWICNACARRSQYTPLYAIHLLCKCSAQLNPGFSQKAAKNASSFEPVCNTNSRNKTQIYYITNPEVRVRRYGARAGENSTAAAGGQTGQDSRILTRKRFLALTPCEMCKITIPAEKLKMFRRLFLTLKGHKSDHRAF